MTSQNVFTKKEAFFVHFRITDIIKKALQIRKQRLPKYRFLKTKTRTIYLLDL